MSDRLDDDNNIETSYRRAYRRNKLKKEKRKKTAIVCASIAAIAVVFICLWQSGILTESRKRMSAESYYNRNGQDPNVIFVVNNGDVADEVAAITDGDTIYVPYDYAKDNINSRFYYNEESGEIFYTKGDGTLKITPGNVEITEADGSKTSLSHTPVINRNGKLYISCDILNSYTNGTVQYYKSPSRVVVAEGKKSITAEKDTAVRYEAGAKSDILTDVKKGDSLVYLGDATDDADWISVVTEDGFKGYAKKSALGDAADEVFARADVETDYSHIKLDSPVCLSWAQVSNRSASANIKNNLENVHTLNVVSPTWYSYADSQGTINDYSTAEAVAALKEAGYKIWPAVNDFTADVDMTLLLKYKKNRDRMIERLISDARYMQYDGINIDFETISAANSADYLQFIRELSIECRKNNIVLSVDVYPPRAYNAFYNVGELACYADYIVMMDYDENYAGSKEAGPVSSISFVRQNLQVMKEYVSEDRIINALPFYSRVWMTDSSGKLTSEALGMNELSEMLKRDNPSISWNEEAGTNYAEYQKDNKTYQIWIEDADSMALKLKATKDAGVSNVGFWRLGLDSDEIWNTIKAGIE